MFSATEPLASSPLAANGTTKLVTGAGAVRNAAQVLAGTAQRRKKHYGSAGLISGAQTLHGTSQRIRVLYGSAAISQAAQRISGSALYTRIIRGSAALGNAGQIVHAICFASVQKTGAAYLLNGAQLLSGTATITKGATGSGNVSNAAQAIYAAATRIRILTATGDLTAGVQEVYGSEFSPIWIKVKSAPLNIYEVALQTTAEPYSTTNHYLTIYQVPGYREVQTDGGFIDRTITAIISACSAATADGTVQPISLIVVKVDGVVTYPLMPSYDVTNGIQNILPLRDFNLVTGDVIQIKALGTGDVTISLSMLLNTQPYFEVL
jgi:hypothetical protein